MTSEDRDLLVSLRRQQAELAQTLAGLNARLGALEARSGATGPDALASLPPIPPEAFLPPIPAPRTSATLAELGLPPLPAHAHLPPVPLAPPSAPRPTYESHFGRWFIRLSMLFSVIVLALVLALHRVQALLGHAGLLAVSAAVSIGVIILAERLERRGGGSLVFGRMVGALALAWLYLTTYAASFHEPLQVIRSPLVGGFLLFCWSIYALLLAKRKKSQLLGLFAITLAYASTAIDPLVGFTMGGDLILAALASAFMLRYGWATLGTVSLAGTYLALFRRLVIDDNGDVVLDTSRTLEFLPHATYLLLAWLIFTGATILTRKNFRGGKRLAFLSLNNAALASLLALTAYIAGYGPGAIGSSLLGAGILFLVTSRLAGLADIEPYDVMGAYAAQGLALFTAGTVVVFTGINRAVALLVETLLLGIAGAFSGDRILIVSTYVTGAFATFFLMWEIAVYQHHPWLFGFGGALVMLINAWSCRSEVRDSPVARTTVVPSSACYSVMAILLVSTAIYVKLNDSTVPLALGLGALVLTFAIYYFAIYELPGAAQLLLLLAQALVLFPLETGEELPWWTTFWVGAITLLFVTWWARQGVLKLNGPIVLITFLYSLALAGLARQMVRPELDAQGWMVGACFLSVLFLAYGALFRVWAMAVVGQIFLVLALYHLFFPPDRAVFPWAWWAAALPIIVLYSSAQGAHAWLRDYSDFPDSYRQPIRLLACAYQLLAAAALVRWVFGLVPAGDQMAAFLFLGTLVLSTAVRRSSRFGVRCSFLFSAIGMYLYFAGLQQAHTWATFLNGFALLLFLSQTALLRHEGRLLVTTLESWGLIVFAVFTNWVFASAWVWTRLSPSHLTMGWALFALFLFLFGFIVRDRRLRWCGLVVMMVSILRVAFHDLWTLSSGYRVLTIMLLTFILLGMGLLISRKKTDRA